MCTVKLGSYYRNLLAVILSSNYMHNLLGPNWIYPTLTTQSSQNMLRVTESLADWLVHLYPTHLHDVCLQVSSKIHLLKMQPRTIMLIAVSAKLERHKGLAKLRLRRARSCSNSTDKTVHGTLLPLAMRIWGIYRTWILRVPWTAAVSAAYNGTKGQNTRY